MKDQSSSNLDAVSWQKGIVIDNNDRPVYPAKQSDLAEFHTNGVVLLRGVFTDWVEALRQGLQRNLSNPQAYAFPCESNPQGEPGRFFDSYCNWQLIPEYLDFVSNSCAASIAGQFMNSTRAQFFHEHAFCKASGTQRATPWHQDLPYYCVDGLKTATVYVSLDHADSDVAVSFVKGSHRWGKLFYPRVFEDGSNLNDEPPADMEPVPDIDANPSEYDLAAWNLGPGDAIVFDYRTLHGTGNAEIKSERRAFSTRWMGDDVTYCDRPGETSPPYTGHDMQHGDSMREDWFPVLWRR
jgi:ectoine hydroxylase-related dioxygenase (phytanoyl-CoA dioxygenase family)